MPVVVLSPQNHTQSRVQIVYQISVLIAFFVLINFVVAGMLMQMEGISYTDAFYTSFSMSLLSGYVGVNNTATKWFVCFYQLAGSIFWSYVCTLSCVAFLDNRYFGTDGYINV